MKSQVVACVLLNRKLAFLVERSSLSNKSTHQYKVGMFLFKQHGNLLLYFYSVFMNLDV